MKYQFIDRKNIKSQKKANELTQEAAYDHFLNHIDECIYVVEGETLVGIVTPGDLHRFYASYGKCGYLNKHYSFVDDIDFEKAREVFEKIKTIHEVPIIKNNVFIGIIKNGEHKTSEEWDKIRERFLPYIFGRIEWREREIFDLLKHIEARIYVYFGFDEKKLKWNEDDWKIYKEKNRHQSGASGLAEMSDCEKKNFFGSSYSEEYVDQFIKEFGKLRAITCNGVSKIDDISGKFFNVCNGKRELCALTEASELNKRICFIGPCTIFGAYVRDAQTIESYLQEMVHYIAQANYEVCNYGMLGLDYFHKLLTEEFAKDDVIIYMTEDEAEYLLWKKASFDFPNVKIGSDLLDAYNGIENPANNILNNIWHCNHVINKRFANIIFKDIEAELKVEPKSFGERTAIQNYYIPWEIVQFYRKYKHENKISSLIDEEVGAIVMNCNPFTKGHRYLIEYASSKVDKLFIFVVEEDLSEFAFHDRFNMVKMGTCDLDNVYVMPSGKYIISKETFAQYFEKDSVTEVNDMSYDLHIFGDVIAKEFGIKVRFVGEEPFDAVTSKYNETMKLLLSKKGINVIEIPRLKNEDQETISASVVRRYMKERRYDKLNTLLPESTIRYLGIVNT